MDAHARHVSDISVRNDIANRKTTCRLQEGAMHDGKVRRLFEHLSTAPLAPPRSAPTMNETEKL